MTTQDQKAYIQELTHRYDALVEEKLIVSKRLDWIKEESESVLREIREQIVMLGESVK